MRDGIFEQFEQLSPPDQAAFLTQLTRDPDASRHVRISHQQRQMWFVDQVRPGSHVYNSPLAFRFRGDLDLIALQASIEDLARRHEVLRSRFVNAEGEPVVLISSSMPPFMVTDLRGFSGDQEAEASRIIAEESRHSFDLAAASPFRTRVITLDNEHIFVVNSHHVVTDGWSIGVLSRDLAEIYRARRQGEVPKLSDLPFQYIDYAAWQNDRINGESMTADLAYWKEALAGASRTLDLSCAKPRPKHRTFRGNTVWAHLDGDVAAKLRTVGRDHDATPFMVYCALYAIMLAGFSGQDDFLIGTPEAGRDQPELHEMLGLFINTIVIRSDLTGTPTFGEFLRRTRSYAFGAYQHARVPFDILVEALNTERHGNRNPMFQALFTYEVFSPDTLELEGLSGEFVPCEKDSAKFDLVLFAEEVPDDGVALALEYDEDLFDATNVQLMLDYLVRVCESVAEDPTQTIASLPAPPATQQGSSAATTAERDRAPDVLSGSAPGDAVESTVYDIWAEILGHEDFDTDDDFFSVGGSSMLALRVVFKIRQEFDLQMELATVFDFPTVAGLAEQVRGPQEEPTETVVAGERGDSGPLSLVQRRLWLLEQTGDIGGSYNSPLVLRVPGELNRAALRGAVTDLTRRHDILRSRFVTIENEPRVRLSDDPPPFRVITLTEGDAAYRSQECRRLVSDEVERPFDLGTESPVRCLVVSESEDEHTVVLNIHHIVSDGWSMGILRRELLVAYRAWCDDAPVSLPAIPLRYFDYVAWQEDLVASPRFGEQIDFWKRTLRDVPRSLDLPTDRARPAQRSHQGATVSARIEPELVEQLRRLGRERNATGFMVYHALWTALLSRYSDQREFLVGVPESGRSRSEFTDLVGFFVNTLVLRADLTGDPTLAALIERTRDGATAAYRNAEVPFDRLVEELHVDSRLDRNPLFQVFYSYDAAGEEGDPDDEFQSVDVDGFTAKFDLDLSLFETSDGAVDVNLSYATDVFDEVSAQSMVRAFVAVAESAARAADTTSVSEVALLQAGEEAALTATPQPALTPSAETLHELVERQATAVSDAVAVRCDGRVLTYGELEHSANQLAWHLRDLGVKPEVPVGLYLPRDERALVAMLAVSKAGGAFVPLDANLPSERLSYMLSDSAVPLVITDSDRAGSLPSFAGRALCLDSEAALIAAREQSRPERVSTATNMAYILYTSGSTGRPKGVVVEHRSAVALVEYYRHTLDTAWVSVVLGASPLGFDASLLEVFSALGLGGSLLMVDSVFDILTHPEADTVTLVQSVPSLMREVLKGGPLPPSVSTVCLGGEAFPGDLVEHVYASGNVQRLYNIYGPTEDTVDSTWATVPRGTTRPSIGRPLPGTRCYVTDERGQLVPRGARGELYLAGPGLARGYLGREDLTEEKFVPDPWNGDGAERMYRTGDEVRLRSDGQLDYLGRVDRLVKLRGMRIELGEIEQALLDQPSVARAAVHVHEGESPQLAAYVVTNPGWDEPRTRAALRARLPEYMVPVSYTQLASIPLTSNGKLDVDALPTPDRAVRQAVVPPRTKTEERLASIWQDVLEIDEVGVHDNFFDIGGTSFKLVSMLSRLEAELGRKVAISTFYASPTIGDLAELCESGRGAASPVPPPPSRWTHTRRPRPEAPLRMYCFPHSGGAAGEYLEWADRLTDVEVWALQLPGRGSRYREPALPSLSELATTIATQVDFAGPAVFFGHSFGSLLAYEVTRQLRRRGRETPVALYLSACGAPETVEPLKPGDTSIDDVSDDELIAEIEARFGGLPQAIHDHADLREMTLGALRADIAAIQNYRFQPDTPLDIPIVALGGLDDTEDETRLATWKAHTTGAFTSRMFPGGHFYTRENSQELFDYLSRTVEQLQ